MVAFHVLPLIQDCMRIPWRVSCMFFSKSNGDDKVNLLLKLKKKWTPYKLFKTELTEKLKQNSPHLSIKEVSITAKDLWEKSSAEEKKKYDHLCQKNLDQYFVELMKKNEISYFEKLKKMKFYKTFLNRKLVELNRPKAPLKAYFRFLQAYRNEQTDKSLKGNKNFTTEMAKKWAELSSSEKEKYKLKYIEERNQYVKDLEKWENDMISKGNFDVIRCKTLAKIHKKS